MSHHININMKGSHLTNKTAAKEGQTMVARGRPCPLGITGSVRFCVMGVLLTLSAVYLLIWSNGIKNESFDRKTIVALWERNRTGSTPPREQNSTFSVSRETTSTTTVVPALDINSTVIYVITPTYWRITQMVDLTRMAQALALVKQLHWILVEDADKPSSVLESLVHRYSITHTILAKATPADIKKKTRGGVQRNAGLDWLLQNNINSGVIYFADDDNSFDIRLFDEIRDTRRVSVFPVGLIGITGVTSPVIKNGVMSAFRDPDPTRKFSMDMAGFAVSVKHWRRHPARFTTLTKPGSLETKFLEQLNITRNDLEFKAKNCTEIYVWHTKTKDPTHNLKTWDKKDYKGTNIERLNASYNKRQAR